MDLFEKLGIKISSGVLVKDDEVIAFLKHYGSMNFFEVVKVLSSEFHKKKISC